jgi:hypothetical protein
LLALFLDNDVADCHPGLTVHRSGSVFLRSEGTAVHFDYSQAIQSSRDYEAQPVYSLRKWLAAYRAASHAFHQAKARRTSQPAGDTIPRRYELYQTSPSPKWQEAWAALEQVLLEFRAEARHQQIPLVVLSVPAGQVVREEAWQGVLRTHPAMQGRDWDLRGPDRRLRALALEHDFILLQPAEVFRRAANGPPLFFGNVGHMTPRGSRCVRNSIRGNRR